MKKISIVLCALLIFTSCTGTKQESPIVQRGQVDLSAVVLEDPRVDVLEGEVYIQKGQGEKIKVDKTAPLNSGTVVIAEENSLATLYWPDGSLSRVKGPGEIVVDHVSFSSNGVDTNIDVEVKSGEVWTKVMDMLSAESDVTIRTAHTVAGIRGTSVYHNVQEGKEQIRTVEHGIEVREIAKNMNSAVMLMEDEEVNVISNKPLMKQKVRGEIPWVENMKEMDVLDKEAMRQRRLQKMEQLLKKTENISAEKSMGNIIANMDRVVMEMAMQKKDLDTSKQEQFKELIEEGMTQIPEEYQGEMAKKIEMYKKILFTTAESEDRLAMRALLQNAEMQFLPKEQQGDRLEKMALRNTFLMHDLLKKQRVDDANEVLNETDGLLERSDVGFQDKGRKEMMMQILERTESYKETKKDTDGNVRKIKERLKNMRDHEISPDGALMNSNGNAPLPVFQNSNVPLRPLPITEGDISRPRSTGNTNTAPRLIVPTNSNVSSVHTPTPIQAPAPVPAPTPTLAPESQPAPTTIRNVPTSSS